MTKLDLDSLRFLQFGRMAGDPVERLRGSFDALQHRMIPIHLVSLHPKDETKGYIPEDEMTYGPGTTSISLPASPTPFFATNHFDFIPGNFAP